MSDRERDLRAGQRERHGFILLYWEPHYDFVPDVGDYVLRRSFTLDVLDRDGSSIDRYRIEKFDDALALLDMLKQKYAVEVAKMALGLDGPGQGTMN